MIHNVETARSRFEEVKNINTEISTNRKEITGIRNNVEMIKLEKETQIEKLSLERQNDIEELSQNLSEKEEELLENKSAPLKELKLELEKVKSMVVGIEEEIDESFIIYKEDPKRKEKIELKVSNSIGIEKAVTELKQIHTNIQNKKSTIDKRSSKSKDILESVNIKVAEFKSNLEFRQRLGLNLFVLLMIYIVVTGFIKGSTTIKIMYSAIGITIGFIYYIINKKVIANEYKDTDSIYKVYNLIEYLYREIKMENLKLEIKMRENSAKISQLVSKISETKISEIDGRFEASLDTLNEEYDARIKLMEFQADMDIGLMDIENLIFELDGTNTENMPVLAQLNQSGEHVEIYYTATNLIINYTEDQETEISEEIMQNLAVEVISKEQLERVKIKLVDPIGLGRKFRDILNLKSTGLSILDNKVYVSNDDISSMLDKSIQKISNVLQNVLTGDHDNVYEYNKLNSDKIEYDFIFIQDLHVLEEDKKIIQKLNTILQHGRDCGVIVIASGHNIDFIENTDKIEINNGATLLSYMGEDVNIPIECVDKEIYDRRLQKLIQSATELGEQSVSFTHMMPSEIWEGDPTDKLDVLIGVKSSGGAQNVRLGGSGINHHILLGGNTGSGKTSFIHTFIISSCLKYSPELLEFILIDFKQGVEFQLYADYKLPHARFLGLESDREYALNILKYLNVEITHRGNLCKELGVADLTGYNNHPNQIQNVKNKMKRTVVIIDEFQELLRGQDTIEAETRTLFDVITRLGRSFGIHLILSSQSISGIPGGLGGVENRLGTRIALRCNEEDSRAILASNNSAAADLDRIGQGIFNDNQGRIAANSKFVFGYIDDEQRIELLNQLKNKADEIGYVPNTQLFYKSNLRHIGDVEWFDTKPQQSEDETNILLGDSSSLTKSYVDITLTRQSGENLLVISKDKTATKSILETVIKSIYHSKGHEEYAEEVHTKIVLLNGEIIGSSTIEPTTLDGVEYRTFGLADDADLIGSVYNRIQDRQEGLDDPEIPIYFIINNIQRIRSLQEDEYASETTKIMTQILREGPYVGVHVIAVLDTYRSLDRIRCKLLNESSHRLIGRMNEMDSSYVINDKMAGILDNDKELIYYNDITNSYEKVRLLEGVI